MVPEEEPGVRVHLAADRLLDALLLRRHVLRPRLHHVLPEGADQGRQGEGVLAVGLTRRKPQEEPIEEGLG